MFGWLFGKKEVHVHLHLSGDVNVNMNGSISEDVSIQKKMAEPYEPEKTVEDVMPDLSDVEIPEVGFGNEDK